MQNTALAKRLVDLEGKGHRRRLTPPNKALISLCHNDYLGFGTNRHYYDAFLKSAHYKALLESDQSPLAGTGSRLVSGNHQAAHNFEAALSDAYDKRALVFGSGTSANLGALCALARGLGCTIIADKAIHASLIDAIGLSGAPMRRYRHGDLEHAASLIQSSNAHTILVVTESVFSMSGRITDLNALCALKADPRVRLYLDCAHGVGVFGERGLGVCEASGTTAQIDVISAGLGKAYGAFGGFVLTDTLIHDYLVNHARTFIYATALPPILCAFGQWALEKMSHLSHVRADIHRHAYALNAFFGNAPSAAPIVPWYMPDIDSATHAMTRLARAGFDVRMMRPPTTPVPMLRFCLGSHVTDACLGRLMYTLDHIKANL